LQTFAPKANSLLAKSEVRRRRGTSRSCQSVAGESGAAGWAISAIRDQKRILTTSAEFD